MQVHSWHLREVRVLTGPGWPGHSKAPAPCSSFSPTHTTYGRLVVLPEWLETGRNVSLCLMTSSGGHVEKKNQWRIANAHCNGSAGRAATCKPFITTLFCRYSGDHRTTARKGIRDRSHLPVLPNEEANTQRLPDLPGASAGDSV